MMRRTAALICASALSMGIVASSHPVLAAKQTCDEPGRIVDRGHRWETIQPPEFGTEKKLQASASDPLNPTYDMKMNPADIAVDPFNFLTIFASDGDRLMRSLDGGCTWKLVFQTEETPANAFEDTDPEKVLDILIPYGGNKLIIYLLVRNRSRYSLVRSSDGGDTWEVINTNGPLDYEGTLGGISIAPSDPNIIYLSSWDKMGTAVSGPQVPGGRVGTPTYFLEYVYVSHDGGKTWEELPVDMPPDAPFGDQIYTWFNVVVDPLDPKDLWAYSNARVRHSTDGGHTWTLMESVKWNDEQGANDLAVQHLPGGPSRVIVTPWIQQSGTAGYEPAFAFRSDDGGSTWYSQSIPEDTVGVEWGGGKNGLAIFSYRGTFRYDERLARANASLPWVPLPPPRAGTEEFLVTQSPAVMYVCNYCVINVDGATIERYRMK